MRAMNRISETSLWQRLLDQKWCRVNSESQSHAIISDITKGFSHRGV